MSAQATSLAGKPPQRSPCRGHPLENLASGYRRARRRSRCTPGLRKGSHPDQIIEARRGYSDLNRTSRRPDGADLFGRASNNK
jgi:hypothetical protein